MNCLICTHPETKLNFNTGKREPVKHSADTTGVICSDCTQVILSSNQDKLKNAHHKALKAGELGKAKVLEGYVGNVGEATKSNGSLDRTRTLRKVGASYHKLRPEHSAR